MKSFCRDRELKSMNMRQDFKMKSLLVWNLSQTKSY